MRNSVLFPSFHKNFPAFCSWPFSGGISYSPTPTMYFQCHRATGKSHRLFKLNADEIKPFSFQSNLIPHQLIVSLLTLLPKRNLCSAFSRVNNHLFINFTQQTLSTNYVLDSKATMMSETDRVNYLVGKLDYKQITIQVIF